MILSNMIKSERAYQEHKKDSFLKEYREAIEKGEDVVALLISEKLLDVNHTLDFLNLQEQIIMNERHYYEFTFDLTGADKEYSKIKDYMTTHGFVWHKDSDYITSEPITQLQMMRLEDNLRQKLQWQVPDQFFF